MSKGILPLFLKIITCTMQASTVSNSSYRYGLGLFCLYRPTNHEGGPVLILQTLSTFLNSGKFISSVSFVQFKAWNRLNTAFFKEKTCIQLFIFENVHRFFFETLKNVHRYIHLCLASFLWACTPCMAHTIKVACPHTQAVVRT